MAESLLLHLLRCNFVANLEEYKSKSSAAKGLFSLEVLFSPLDPEGGGAQHIFAQLQRGHPSPEWL